MNQTEVLNALTEALNADAELAASDPRGLPAVKRLAPILDYEHWSREPQVVVMSCCPVLDTEAEDSCGDAWNQVVWVGYSEGLQTPGETDDVGVMAELTTFIDWIEVLARRVNNLEVEGVGKPIDVVFSTEGHPLFVFDWLRNHRLFVSILRVTYSERE